MNKIQIAIFVVLGLALALSVYTDLKSRQIKNVVTMPTIVLCLGLRLAGAAGTPDGWWGSWEGTGVASGVAGMVIGFGVFYLGYLTKGFGGGDVKLMAAVGAGVGFWTIIPCVMFIAVSGGVYALLQMLWDGQFLSTFAGMGRKALKFARVTKEPGPQGPKSSIPYGVPIAVGTVWGVIWTLQQAGQRSGSKAHRPK